MMKPIPTDRLLATTLRAIGDGVISCDTSSVVVMMNEVAATLTGWPERDAIGRPLREVFRIVNETTRQPVPDPIEKALRFGRVMGLANHTLLLRPDGTEIAIGDSAAPIFGDDGRVQGAVLVFRDMTERRKAELNLELLSESGTALGAAESESDIVSGVSGIATRHFADMCVFHLLEDAGEWRDVVGDPVHPGLTAYREQGVACSMEGGRRVSESGESAIRPCELLKHSATETHAGEPPPVPRSLLTVPLLAGRQRLGALTFLRWFRASPFDAEDAATAEDLGRRVATALRFAEVDRMVHLERARLQTVVEHVPVGIVVADTSGKVVLSNSEVERIFRHPAIPTKDVDGHGAWVAFHPDGNRVQPREFPLIRAMQEGRPVLGMEALYQRGDGSRAWVELSAAPLRGLAGEVTGGVVAVVDIDADRRAQQALQLSEERFRLLVDRASVGINIGDLNGNLFYMNPALCRLLGYTQEEVEQGKVSWSEITPPEFAARDRHAIDELRATGRATPYEKSYRAKDGRLVPLILGAVQIPSLNPDADEPDCAVFCTDLSTLKQTEAALLQTEKLAAVGKLASSISHEINNPLEAVTNLLYIVRSLPDLPVSARDYLISADRELARVSQVVSQTLRFHRQSTTAQQVRPDRLLDEVLSLYSTRLAAAQIAVTREGDRSLEVVCFEGEIRQVLNNLVSNAFDAMRRGGRLRLRINRARNRRTGEPGAKITIGDTGAGMTPEVSRRVFDAFYTTKGLQGTGLGLWICSRIVLKHGGELRLRSRACPERHGTVFTLWLPTALTDTERSAQAFDSRLQGLALQ